MIKLDKDFLFGEYTEMVAIESKAESVISAILKLAFENNMIDCILASITKNNTIVPGMITDKNNIDDVYKVFFIQSGQNTLIKTAIQKYRFKKLAIVGPACVMDGVNKLQYYGIGCNWAKSRIALKLGIFCAGSVSYEGLKCQLLESGTSPETITKNYFEGNQLTLEMKNGKKVKIKIETHHNYINQGCRYCLNISSRGADLTFIPYKLSDNSYPIIIRSKRGDRIVKKLAKKSRIRKIDFEEFDRIKSVAENIVKLNIEHILERAELKLPSSKWNINRFTKFYEAWNSVETKILDERIL